ncbi:hypothetical protein [Okibacterium fritillariae]|uniref:Uncharacterized protein n=1 Tax=Okibacterium fritillariae TaxID=123320 RepID=A0A1T5JGB0_9MICO|nr:hypothetical protein [Okibacterium fritillariae]SKC50376.1 hypothetical protein SAMN06309945_1515 [Okibacterium fritillariae]
MPDFGPFSVDPAQVAALGGANFGQFVARLLATESAAHGMAGTALETTYLENVGDGGVDAGLRGATRTEWVPAGDSAWQFKAGDLGPAKCKEELEGATKAIETLRAGGSYRLVLGASLTSAKIASRRTKLVEAASGLGIADAEIKIELISGDQLARWIETYPALAVSPLLGGIGRRVLSYAEWSNSHPHDTIWTESPLRTPQVEGLHASLGTAASRIEGVSGLGKSRFALEALRGEQYEPLVIYAPAADQFPIDLLIQLRTQGRIGIVVIDECDRKEHEILASTLAINSPIRLVTIGEQGLGSTRSPILNLSVFGDEPMQELLRTNRANLSPEASRVVIQVAAGNIDYALKLAQVAIDGNAGSAGGLIAEDDLRAFFTDQLPDGQLFLASCALALFSRFGFDGEPAMEIDAIARGLGLSVDDLRGAAASLQRHGLLSKQGRYRSVGPHPVAVYLAARGWDEFGRKIVAELLPQLDSDLTERLFRRAADIGDLDAASPAMAAVLGSDGPLASLDAIADGDNSGLLTHFAVLAPEIVANRLADLISSASEDDLIHARGIRRDLVWALEKLAWHSRTFLVAANALLRLAKAENETYSNNASGTWVEFFGAILPGTAAAPTARMDYLRECASSVDPRVRQLVVRGADRALDAHESIMVSGEVQGGLVVEPRGRPETFGEVWTYRNEAIDVLASLTTDEVDAIATDATKQLVGSIHGLLETEANREHLGHKIATLSAEVISKARIEVESLRTLFVRVETEDGRPAALAAFNALLPPQSPTDRLRVLASTRSWDRGTDDLAEELVEIARQVDSADPGDTLAEVLRTDPELPSAYAIGRAIQLVGVEYAAGVAQLSEFVGTPNGEALIGFLHSLVNSGDSGAFDRYLDETDLAPVVALQYSVRGARTQAAAERVDRLVSEVSVVEAARVLFAWMHGADQAESARYLQQWERRIVSQADYNAAVDFAAMQLHGKTGPLPDLDAVIIELVPRRREYPDMGQESRDWSVLARRQIYASPLDLVRLLVDLVEADAVHAFTGSAENRLLQEAVSASGEEAWVELMNRLERGEWRLSFSAREWLGNAATVEAAARWVGGSVERARVLANVTSPGGATIAPVARYLIDTFGEDERVSSYLVGQFISGMWSGNESDRINSQIAEVQSWMAAPTPSANLRAWGRRLVANLEARLQAVIQEEEERGW